MTSQIKNANSPGEGVGTGSPEGVGISSLLVTPQKNGEIGAMSAESVLAGIEKHSKSCNGLNE